MKAAGARLLVMAITVASVSAQPNTVSLALLTEQPTAQVEIGADVLSPPSGLTCNGGSTSCTASLISRPQLNWAATPDTYAQGYRILRSTTNGGPYTQVGSVVGRSTTSFTDTGGGLSLLTTYYYVVVAYAASWTSVPSNQVAVTVLVGI